MNKDINIVIYSDPHLSARNYGAHRNYPLESLKCLSSVADVVERYNADYCICTGDFTYGRFNTLEYRLSVEKVLQRINSITNNNHYMIKGNHDSASYGMTEYEYYVNKGVFKSSSNLDIGNCHITMVDYHKHLEVEPNISFNPGSVNFILAHDYYKFSSTRMPDYGKPIVLDQFDRWFGADYLICGHVHKQHIFKGSIVKEIDGLQRGHEVIVNYTGSLSRPSYIEGGMDLVGTVGLIKIHKDNGEITYSIVDVELLPLEESFNIEQKEVERQEKIEKENRVDISDIIERLSTHERNIGDPEHIILSLEGVDERYKAKAIELLKNGLAY